MSVKPFIAPSCLNSKLATVPSKAGLEAFTIADKLRFSVKCSDVCVHQSLAMNDPEYFFPEIFSGPVHKAGDKKPNHQSTEDDSEDPVSSLSSQSQALSDKVSIQVTSY